MQIAAASSATAPKDTTKYWGDAGTNVDINWAGSGTEKDPYLITSAAELAGLSYRVYNDNVKNESEKAVSGSNNFYYKGMYFKQTCNLDLSDYWWQPIGVSEDRSGSYIYRYFSGNYNGDGHIISGLYTQIGGLFGYIYGDSLNKASITGLGIVEGNLQGSSCGGIAGIAKYAILSNCYNAANISGGSGVAMGGIAGTLDGTTINNCYNLGNISVGSGSCAGGICGGCFSTSLITNCFNIGKVEASGGSVYLGGIAGDVWQLTEYNYFGGECTLSEGLGSGGSQCKNIVDLGSKAYAKEKDWYKKSENWDVSYPWDFDNIWFIDPIVNNSFPVFKSQIKSWYPFADAEWTGDGLSEATAYIIDTPEKLAGLSVQVKAGNSYSGKYFKQTADISLGGYEWLAIGNWTAASSSNGKYFAGSFDGKGHTITSLTVRDKTEREHGLFGWIRGGTVKNVKMKNVLINTAVEAPTGAVVGVLSDNAVLNNCQVNGATITSNSRVGGLVGFAINGVSVLNSSFNGDVTSIGWWAAGGITGVLQDGKMENCLSSGRIKAVRADAGGLSGTSQGTLNVISNCISYCTVESGCTLGGLVGRGSAKIINSSCYGLLSYDPSKAYNLTADYGTESAHFIGGIYGYVSSNDYVNMENCVFYGSGDSLTNIQPFYEGEGCSIINSYSIINGKGYYSNGDFSGWSIMAGMNDDLPMQKALYAVAQFGDSIDANWFVEKGFEKI